MQFDDHDGNSDLSKRELDVVCNMGTVEERHKQNFELYQRQAHEDTSVSVVRIMVVVSAVSRCLRLGN